MMRKRLVLLITIILIFSIFGSISASAAIKTTTANKKYTFMCPVGGGIGLVGTRVVHLYGKYADTYEYTGTAQTINFKSKDRNFYLWFNWNYDESVSYVPYLKGQYGLYGGSYNKNSQNMSRPGPYYSGSTHSYWLAGTDDVTFLTQTTSAIGKMEYTFICPEAIVGGVTKLEIKTTF